MGEVTKLSDEELADVEARIFRACTERHTYVPGYPPPPPRVTFEADVARAMLHEVRDGRAKEAEIPPAHAALRSVRDEIDTCLAAHDTTDPRHPSHGGQHHNGRCCVLGNVGPSAIRGLRDWRDVIDRVIGSAR